MNRTKDIVNKYGFKFTKSLGQNFLTDDTVLRDIIDGSKISKDDYVIEIGPGVGTLTRELLNRANWVYSIEIDKDLIPVLNEELKEFNNFTLINKDVLKYDFNEIIDDNKSIKVIANLPYYITTPIISKLLNNKYNVKSMTFMVQKEVGERMCASPSKKEYGALSLLIQYYCKTTILRNVPASSFIPQPKVESVVVLLERYEKPLVNVRDEKLFFRIIRDSFNMRRKTLWNALKELKLGEENLKAAFLKADIDSKRRGETLSIFEFAKLSEAVEEYF